MITSRMKQTLKQMIVKALALRCTADTLVYQQSPAEYIAKLERVTVNYNLLWCLGLLGNFF